MRLRVLAVGKLKDAALDAACADYVKRSQPFLPIERSAHRDNSAAMRAAFDLGSQGLAGSQRTIVMDERGEQITSEELSQWLDGWRSAGVRSVGFLIGDAHGWDAGARKSADKVLGLSRLTLPHRFAQLLLCEQLYRAGTILAGHPYHH